MTLTVSDIGQHLVDEPVVDVDAPGVGAGQVSHELFERRGVLERIPGQDLEQGLGLGRRPEAASFLASLWAWRV